MHLVVKRSGYYDCNSLYERALQGMIREEQMRDLLSTRSLSESGKHMPQSSLCLMSSD